MPADNNSAVPGSIEMLEKVVENCRIYEVSKKVVEKFCRNQSKNVVETSRNLSKFV